MKPINFFIKIIIIILLLLNIYTLALNYFAFNRELVDAKRAHYLADKRLEKVCIEDKITYCDEFETSGPYWDKNVESWILDYRAKNEKHDFVIFVYQTGRTHVNSYRGNNY